MAFLAQPVQALQRRAARRRVLDRALATKAALWISLALYSVPLVAMIPYHEPWYDEAHSWLLARDSNLTDLLTHWLRYEGTPGLWHLILFVPAHLHLPIVTMNIIAAALSIAAIVLLLWRSPFPLALRVVLPFSFFLFYQYSVVARSYALMPLLLFALAAIYPKRLSSPHIYAYAGLLVLLAQTNAFGTIIAAFIALLLAVDLARESGLRALVTKRSLGVGALIGVGLIAAYLQARPYADGSFASAPPDWNLHHLQGTATGMLDVAFAGQAIIAIGAVTISLIWFWRTKTFLLYVLPTLGVGTFAAVRYANFYHQGILILIWLFALWISFYKEERAPVEPWLKRLAVGVIFLIVLVQVRWSFYSYRYDFLRPFSGGPDAAQYLKANHLENARIDAYGQVDAIQPYFAHNIFYNNHAPNGVAFFLETKRKLFFGARSPQDFGLAVANDHPDVIVYYIQHAAHEPVPVFPGYIPVHYSAGSLYWKTSIFQNESFVIFRRIGP